MLKNNGKLHKNQRKLMNKFGIFSGPTTKAYISTNFASRPKKMKKRMPKIGMKIITDVEILDYSQNTLLLKPPQCLMLISMQSSPPLRRFFFINTLSHFRIPPPIWSRSRSSLQIVEWRKNTRRIKKNYWKLAIFSS